MMMRALLSTFLLLSICGCSDRSSIAAPYKSLWDRFIVQLGLGFGYTPCYRDEASPYGNFLGFIGNEQCYRFNPPERMRGIWLDEDEDSEFLPNATRAPAEWRYSPNAIWLDFTRHEPLLNRGNGEPQAFALEFIGRRATYPGRYGHMGGSRHLVIVKKLLSARRIPAPKRD
ncbi:MAG: hypothetical protein WKF52_06495 [Sphingomicrobium sp.]